MSGIPNLNLLYEGPEGIVVCHVWEGRYVIHSELYNPEPTLDDLKAAQKISHTIDEAFKEKGIKELYTWGENDTHARYNKFLGFKETGRVMNSTFVDSAYPIEVLEYRKELN
ncbi:MAG: hypothetical protein Tp178MES00d2C33159091_32 [Prokaryotic dsDNA virus sp.]|uniref:hypothetical protein n=1 Tax=Thalassospira sp. TaxID=1912094 RepID=UPI000C5814F6|nr:hypothetical protein [Thalassospira sp.]QDP60981.1 MAG: hypothetical protein Tp178MES00d2C33159091_32 [Prokaryotic dsDNA virus sp.]MAZ33832.1 hypothetical protein [Thalassospira sp.]MAZ33888.1 hypothetical protein [Thalassospira sp.]MAZ34619.1 hypothetical protein [Thalassospira sp.]QDP64514.1 MAG: hypothetical protein Tp178SUR1139111_34 [Prokaryotic dsDNA virus sp.]|tara:strand:- start:34246 stop:34581 length:336 start_codon:yes stop_codon:yes gene_type:complete